MKNITFDLMNQAQKSPNKPALILSEISINYQTTNKLVWNAASLFFEKGVKEGDTVGILQNNEILRILSSLAIIRLGATVVPLARSLTQFQIDSILRATKITKIISDLSDFPKSNISFIHASLQEIINQKQVNYNIISEQPASDCLIISGSGSSGKQKMIPQTHENIKDRISLGFPNNIDQGEERTLSLTNLEFASGINRLLSVFHIGGSYCVLDKPINSLVKYCHEKKITTLFTSVFHMESLIRSTPKDHTILLPQLNSLRISGSSVSLKLRNTIREKVCSNLHLIYGANECGRITFSYPPKVYENQFTVGKPLPGVTVEITNSDGVLIQSGQKGLIRVKTPSVVRGYLNDREETEKRFKNGWFYTGDIGELTDDGSLQIFGRSDDMMISNGINIYPIEIEQTLLEIAEVKDVVAIPLKHEIYQEIPIAVVSLVQNSKLTTNEIKTFADLRLGFRSPRIVIIINEIPRNANGKLQREELFQILKKSKQIS